MCVWDRKISSVSEERNKNAEGLNNKATELLVCPGGRGRYRGILSLKKPLQSANGVTKDSVGKALLLSVNRELVLETCAAATRRRWAGPKHNILCVLALVSCLLFCLLFLSSLFSPYLPPVVSSSDSSYLSLLYSFLPSYFFVAQAPTHISSPASPSNFLQTPLDFLSLSLLLSCLLELWAGLWGPLPFNLPWPPGVRGEDAVAAALRTSPPCLQSCGGKWHWTKEHLIPVSDSILSARVNEREASFCPYAAAFSPTTPERRSVFDACPALRHFFLSFWMMR